MKFNKTEVKVIKETKQTARRTKRLTIKVSKKVTKKSYIGGLKGLNWFLKRVNTILSK